MQSEHWRGRPSYVRASASQRRNDQVVQTMGNTRKETSHNRRRNGDSEDSEISMISFRVPTT